MSLINKKRCDVILINPPPWEVNMPPLGIATLSSFLRRNKINSEVFDINNELYYKVEKNAIPLFKLESQQEWVDLQGAKKKIPFLEKYISECSEKILEKDPLCIGISISNPKEYFSIALINKIREKSKILIILGGSMCLDLKSRKSIIKKIDDPDNIIFIVGDGEIPLLKIIQKIKKHESALGVQGAIYIKKGQEINNTLPLRVSDLNIIGFPDYKEFNMARYPNDSFIVEWSRGCLYNCAFCITRELQGNYRQKSPETRLEEIMFLKKEYGFESLAVSDNMINGDIKALKKTCDLIIGSGLQIRWSAMASPTKEMDEDIFIKLKKSGCFRLDFGIESGSETVLRKMKKPFNPETAGKVLANCKKQGIEPAIFLMVGFPGETEDEFRKTLQFLEKNRENIGTVLSFKQLYVFPGTQVYDFPERYGILGKEDWNMWYTKDGNSFELRMRRLREMKEKLIELKLGWLLSDV